MRSFEKDEHHGNIKYTRVGTGTDEDINKANLKRSTQTSIDMCVGRGNTNTIGYGKKDT